MGSDGCDAGRRRSEDCSYWHRPRNQGRRHLAVVGLAIWSAQQLAQREPESHRPVTVERSNSPDESTPSVAEPLGEAPPSTSAVEGAVAPPQPSVPGRAAKVERPTPRQPRARTADQRAAPQERPNDFVGELSLMQRAVQARRAGQIAQARALIAEHARRYPQGALRAERERLAAPLAAGTTPD